MHLPDLKEARRSIDALASSILNVSELLKVSEAMAKHDKEMHREGFILQLKDLCKRSMILDILVREHIVPFLDRLLQVRFDDVTPLLNSLNLAAKARAKADKVLAKYEQERLQKDENCKIPVVKSLREFKEERGLI